MGAARPTELDTGRAASGGDKAFGTGAGADRWMLTACTLAHLHIERLRLGLPEALPYDIR